MVKNDDISRSPTVGGFQPYLRPLQLRGGCAFPILRRYGTARELISRISTSDESHLGQKTTILRGRQRWGGFRSYFRPLQLRGVSLFQFYGFTALWGTNFPNRHVRRVAFWSKTPILRERQRWVDFGPFFAHYNYEGFRFSNFTALRNFWKLIFLIATSDVSHLGQKR